MSNPNEKINIGISIGDYNGVGLEVVLKTFADNRIFKDFSVIIYASSKVVNYHKKNLGLNDVNFQIINNIDDAKNRDLYVLNCWEEEVAIEFGKVTKQAGEFALKSLSSATEHLKSGKLAALVTAPLNKYNIQSETFKFPGHTEYLQDAFGAKDHLMILCNENIRVGLITGHIPIAEVASKLSKEAIVSKAQIFIKSLIQDFGIRKPKIAILGLNPHAGDNGLIGKEEQEIIIPAIESLKNQNHIVYGPYGADGFFGSGAYAQFDGILAMYHDQGLIPFKTLAFSTGVNFTAGLPIIRTSPDHGTAYDIAGKNLADFDSFKAALYMAIDIFSHRKMNKELTNNPLKSSAIRYEKDN